MDVSVQGYDPGAVLAGLRGPEHLPRSKFRFQRELTGVINSFSSAKTHCREPTRSYNARTLNYDHTYYVYEHAHCKSTLCFYSYNNVPLQVLPEAE